jgi:hypothetical protein
LRLGDHLDRTEVWPRAVGENVGFERTRIRRSGRDEGGACLGETLEDGVGILVREDRDAEDVFASGQP